MGFAEACPNYVTCIVMAWLIAAWVDERSHYGAQYPRSCSCSCSVHARTEVVANGTTRLRQLSC